MNNELLTIWIVASVSKYLRMCEFGLSINILQQPPEKNTSQDKIEFLLTGPNFLPQGTINENYALFYIRALLRTKFIESDMLYHTRIKARILNLISKPIPVQKVGGNDTRIYDGSKIGYLDIVPYEQLTITPISVEEPNASLIEVVHRLTLC